MTSHITSNPMVPAAAYTDQPGGDFAIQLSDVGIRYRLLKERSMSLKEFALKRLRGRNEYTHFWALRNITLSVPTGESLGIIGANGAGKSTLLRVIARIMRPTIGRSYIRGSVAPILELGALFDPELTGRENIYLNGAMFGHSRQTMNTKLDALLDFSGLGNFIDSPLRTYSDGMVARLAFAISTDIDADILLIDEVLAVGDNQFNQKCILRMESFQEKGATLVVVSHNLSMIEKLCSRVIWLEHGRIKAAGLPEDIISSYEQAARQDLFDRTQTATA